MREEDENYALERLVDAVIVRLLRHGCYPPRALVRDLIEQAGGVPLVLCKEVAAKLIEVGFLLRRGPPP